MLPHFSGAEESGSRSPAQEEIEKFCHAARDGDVSAVSAFLAQYDGGIINERDSIAARAITWAAFMDRRDVIELLLDKGALIDAGGTKDRPALGWAAQMGYTEAVRLLLERGANPDVPDSEGQTPLMLARGSGHAPIAELIVHWTEQRRELEEREKERRKNDDARAASATRLQKLRKIKAPRL